MDFKEWIDEAALKNVVIGIIIGTMSASIRAIWEKEKVKASILRIMAGAMMGGLFSYIIKDIGLPSIIEGTVLFASGYACGEFAATLSKIGIKKIPGNEEADTEEVNTPQNEH